MIVENTKIYNTIVVYPLKNNTGKNFSVPFPVDSEMSSLLVYIDEQQTETGWTFDTESSVVAFTEAPTGGSLIIRRKTKTDAPIVTFNPGSILSDREQNRNSKQMICAIQEIEDLYALYKDELIGYNTLFKDYYDSVTAAGQAALTAAQVSANSAESSATIYAQIAWIWTEITGDDTLFDKAFITAKEAAEATGAIDTAAEAAKAGINEASQAALNHALAEVKEAKESSLDALTTATGSANASIDLKISEAIGADGTLTVMKEAAEQAYANATEQSESIQASMTAAKDVVDSAVAGALQRAEEAVDRGEQVEQSVLTALQQAQNASSSASGSATAALQQAQAAADAKVAAESAQAAAEAAAGEAGSLVNASVTAHNSNPSAHPAIQNKFADYLPLAGGTMTGSIKRNGSAIQNPTSGGQIKLIGDSNGADQKGGALFLFDKANSTYPGWFILRAGAENTSSDLQGTAPGKLTWMGHDVLRSYFAKADNTGMIQLFAGTDYLNGGYLRLHGLTNSESQGGFHLGTGNGTTNHELKGTPDGQLTWDGKTILNDGRDAVTTTHTAGSGTSFVWYRKYPSGWVEQGGFVASGATSITFPVAFANTDYCLLRTRLTQEGNDISDHCQNISTRSATGFTLDATYAPTNGSWWYACGSTSS